MVYEATDSWHKNAEGNRQQWVNAFINHGVDPSEANEIVTAYTTWFPRIGLNYDMGMGQMVQETGWASSYHWTHEHNPAGIGITDETVLGQGFGTIEQGVTAHAAHLCCYVYTADQCPIEQMGDDMANLFNDPRHIFHDGFERLMDLERPGRKWAFPGDGYVNAILTIVNAVVSNPQPPPPPVDGVKRLSELDIDWSQQTSVNIFGANGWTWAGRGAYPIRAIVCHVMDGTYDGSISWANNPASKASFNFGVSQSGKIACVVDPRGPYAPWANAVINPGTDQLPDALADLRDGSPNANYVTVSIEHEGHPFDGNFPTPAQLNASTQLCAALMIEYSLDASRDTITGHFQYDPVGRANCPGPNFNLDAYTARVQAILAGTEHNPTGPVVKINGHVIGGGFLALWGTSSRPYQTFGIPISEEHDVVMVNRASGEEKPVTIQEFDRVIMVHDASEGNPEWQDTVMHKDWRIK